LPFSGRRGQQESGVLALRERDDPRLRHPVKREPKPLIDCHLVEAADLAGLLADLHPGEVASLGRAVAELELFEVDPAGGRGELDEFGVRWNGEQHPAEVQKSTVLHCQVSGLWPENSDQLWSAGSCSMPSLPDASVFPASMV